MGCAHSRRAAQPARCSGKVSSGMPYYQQLRSSRIHVAALGVCRQRHVSMRQLSVTVTARRGGRALMYEEENTYVILEPGEDEKFVTPEELQQTLVDALTSWDGPWPKDLQKFKDASAAAAFLVASGCELDLGGTRGELQWYSVRLE
eukprot:CAMPEP_0198206046 /NCGR_PEP_ID=MMETSP1445-20131203/9575_1 /TAXON_ID=36898 /ORGANISM="Pyramimonas sp., Strain CCMP2087" /LENGTH=146 /DNA_ID=CAMNT_0043878581 /DNA_START=150 /DNA_END=590 /DNA_ORIENTATION=+